MVKRLKVLVNLTNWTNDDNDNNLQQRLKDRFTNEALQRRKITELQSMKQKGETVEEYTNRFKKTLRIAVRGGVNLHNNFKIEFYLQGLDTEIQIQTRLSSPQTLQEAIDRAKLVEETKNTVLNNVLGTQKTQPMEEILQEQTNKNKQTNRIYEEMNKEKTNKDIEELTQKFEKVEAHLANLARSQNRPHYQNSNLICRNCKRPGHTMDRCMLMNYTCYGCGQRGHTTTYCPQRQTPNRPNIQRSRPPQNVNYVDNYYDYEDAYYTEYNEYDNYYMDDDDEIYYTNFDLYEAERTQKGPLPGPYNKNRLRRSPRKNQEQIPIPQPQGQQLPEVQMKNLRVRKNRAPNMIDQQPEYDITNNILNQKADVTIGQIFKLTPKLSTQFKKQAFVRPIIEDQ